MTINELTFKKNIKTRIENEKRAVKLLSDSIKMINNRVIRLLFHQIALESIKHAEMLKTVLYIVESSSKEPKSESEEFQKTLKMHVEVERKMLRDFEKIVDMTRDKRIRFILQTIISDEKRHHTLMNRLQELVLKGNGVQDEKWWDFLYRYSRLTS